LTERSVGNPSEPRQVCRPERPGRGRLHRHGFLPYRLPKISWGSSVPSGYGPLALCQDSGGLWHLSSHKTPDTLRQRSRGLHCGRAWQDRLDKNLRAQTATRNRRDPGRAEEAHLTRNSVAAFWFLAKIFPARRSPGVGWSWRYSIHDGRLTAEEVATPLIQSSIGNRQSAIGYGLSGPRQEIY